MFARSSSWGATGHRPNMDDGLTAAAQRLFASEVTPAVLRDADAGQWQGALWEKVAAAGFTAALLPEDAGGFGVTAPEAIGLVRVAASYAAPLPLCDSMLGR